MTGHTGPQCGIVATTRQLTAVVKVDAPLNQMPETQRSARAKLKAALSALDTGERGASCTLWRPPADGRMAMEPGMIVSRAFEPAGDVVPSSLPAGRAARLVVDGSFEGIPGGWQTLFGWCAKEKLKLAGVNWETYSEWDGDPAKCSSTLYALVA